MSGSSWLIACRPQHSAILSVSCRTASSAWSRLRLPQVGPWRTSSCYVPLTDGAGGAAEGHSLHSGRPGASKTAQSDFLFRCSRNPSILPRPQVRAVKPVRQCRATCSGLTARADADAMTRGGSKNHGSYGSPKIMGHKKINRRAKQSRPKAAIQWQHTTRPPTRRGHATRVI